jgi:hypothetical protein
MEVRVTVREVSCISVRKSTATHDSSSTAGPSSRSTTFLDIRNTVLSSNRIIAV